MTRRSREQGRNKTHSRKLSSYAKHHTTKVYILLLTISHNTLGLLSPGRPSSGHPISATSHTPPGDANEVPSSWPSKSCAVS